MTNQEPSGDRIARRSIFLLSPANASGIRGQRLLGPDCKSDLAQRLRQTGAPIGEVYQFISSLYFRGKLAYAKQFTNPPPEVAGIHVITGAGLILPETAITLDELRQISAIPLDVDNAAYRLPLDRDLFQLRKLAGGEADVIL